MKRKTKELAMAMAVVLITFGLSFAIVPGDVNNDGKIGLEDIIYGLQVVAGVMTTTTTTTVSTTTTTIPSGADYTNTVGMSFKLIAAGTFTMGSPITEPGRVSEETLHQVSLTKSFYMQTTEVTQGQWKAVMGGSNPSYFSACGDNCPVEQVSWDDIQTFLTALNSKSEGTYLLPTEAEWEYAARAGSTTAFYNGEITNTGYTPIDPSLDVIGWYYGNSMVTYTPNLSGKGTHPVAQKQANNWGLYDMAGNVWEWCNDRYLSGNYPTTAVTDPTGPSTGEYRVLRGGSWGHNAYYSRSASRGNHYSYWRDGSFGFRLVRLVAK